MWTDDMAPAIAQLKVDMDFVKQSEPFKRKRGDKAQAELQSKEIKSYEAAIKYLRQRNGSEVNNQTAAIL